jgi:hypothetical protein
MAFDQVLATLRGLLDDPDVGLGAKVAALDAEAGRPAGTVPTAFTWQPWTLSGVLHPATAGNLVVRPRRLTSAQKPFAGSLRDGRHDLEVLFETTHHDPARLETILVAVSTALLQVLDGIEAYSRTHGGTIEQLEDPVEITFGSFDGPATTEGFLATFTALERSTR